MVHRDDEPTGFVNEDETRSFRLPSNRAMVFVNEDETFQDDTVI